MEAELQKRSLESSVSTPTDSLRIKPTFLTCTHTALTSNSSSSSFSNINANAHYWIDKYALCYAFLASLSQIIINVFSATFLNSVYPCDLESSAREGRGMIRKEKCRTTRADNSAQSPRFSIFLTILAMPKHNQ